MTRSVYSLTSEDWKDYLISQEKNERLLPYLLAGIYQDRQVWQKHLSPSLIKNLIKDFSFDLPTTASLFESEDFTTKFQIQFSDGLEVETVLIPFHKRYTICLSTQVGCAMNCNFCYTGTQGLKRNLTSCEIVGQYITAFNYLKKTQPFAPKPSIVFMGQGEPLHNKEEVKQAISILGDPLIFGIGHRQMTLSTVGYLPGLQDMSTFPQVNMALSLHSPFQEERNKLIPLNQRFPLTDIMEALDKILLKKKQFITFEYLLIKNLNMTSAHAEALYQLLANRPAIINLIPFNPFPGSEWERPSLQDIHHFKALLVEKKLRVMIRTTKGDDILAACGQLKINKMARNYVHEN
jgi:23S rRNA (adenine2503-C2)-methyltransferase